MSKIRESMKIFDDFRLGTLRAVMHEDGEPWFVLQDVLRILEMNSKHASEISERLDPSEKGNDIVVTLGGPQEMLTVSEGGLYYLICTSRKPNAKAFRLWVTGTVLVSIRKNKSYILGQEDLDPQEREDVSRKASALSPVKDNPMGLGMTYIASDGLVFFNAKDCAEYNRSLRE